MGDGESAATQVKTSLDPAILAYYNRRPEETRLERGLSQLEAERTRMLADFEARWADPRQRADLLWAAETVEQEPSLLGLSSHLLAVARRPTHLNV